MNIEINKVAFLNLIIDKDEQFYDPVTDCFEFKNVIFNERMVIDLQITQPFKFSFGQNTTFTYELILASEFLRGLEIKDGCIFRENLQILGAKQNCQIVILGGAFFKNLSISNINSGGLLISDPEIKSDFTLTNNTLDNVLISNIKVGGNLKLHKNNTNSKIVISGGSGKETSIKNLILEKVKHLELGNDFSPIKIDTIEFKENDEVDYVINFKSIMIRELKFNKFTNRGIINFSNINGSQEEPELNKFIASNSNLGEINFAECDFSNFQFNIKSSRFQNIILTECDFCEPSMIGGINDLSKSKNSIYLLSKFKQIHDNNGDFNNSTKFHEAELNLRLKTLKTSNHREEKDIFSQLKKMYEQRGDSVKSLEYQAKELEIYRKSITWGSHFFEKFNLSINRFTNNYGTNWALALLVTIVINAVFFTWYCILLGYTFDIKGKYFWELFSYSFEFLNPLRKADFIPNMKVTPGARIVDYSARILVTLCVYQLIQAFRKYGKK